MKKNIQKLGMILLNSIIIIFSLIIGANDKYLRVIPISILLVLIIIFLLCKKISNKKESIFFKNKIDIYVLIFILSTSLPLIFKTYSSLSYQIEFMIKYIFYYSVYILSRNVIKTKKDINIVFTTIIITSLIPIFLGIDMINGLNIFSPIIKFFDLTYGIEYKPGYNFGYSNVMAIYLSLCIFLSIYKISNTKDKTIKLIYLVYILMAIYNIYLCYSRMPSILLVLFLIIYFINKYKDKIKTKKNITIGIILLLVIIPIFSYSLTKSKPFITTEKKYEKNIIYKFKKNKKYNIKLDVDFLNTNNYIYSVRINSVNKYYKENSLTSYEYNIGHHIIEYEYIPKKDTDSIVVYIDNTIDGQIKINNIYINNKEYIINYKYLPQKISKFISFLTLKDKSLVERYYFYKDSIKIFKKHPLIGNGGDAWRSLSKVNQDYTFSVKETHSYFFELLIEYGLIGVILYFIMLIKIIISLFKNKTEENKIIIYALGILLIHSITFDFDMSFMFIEIIVYTLFSCILSKEKKNIKINIKYDYLVFIILFITLIITTYMSLYKYNIINKKYYLPINRSIIENKVKNINEKTDLDFLKTTMKYEPYLNQNHLYKNYFEILIKNEKNISDKDISNYLDFIINHLDKTEVYSPLYIDTLFDREKIIYDSINSLNNSKIKNKDIYIKKLKNIIKKNYNKNISIIKDIERNGYNKYDVDKILTEYKNIYEEVK